MHLYGLILTLTLVGQSAVASDYGALRERAAAQCGTIDQDEAKTGLLFNPDGHRSFYVKSRCLQDVAIRFRDRSLCDDVRRRWSLFSSSWGVSSSQCRKLVDEGMAIDLARIESLKSRYEKERVSLVDFRVERNGNGRDFDFIPAFSGGGGRHAYTLSFRLSGNLPIHRSGYSLDGVSDNIRIYVEASDIARTVPGFSMQVVYDVTAELEYSIGNGSSGGLWSDEFIARSFPAGARTQTMVKRVRFGDTTFEPYIIE